MKKLISFLTVCLIVNVSFAQNLMGVQKTENLPLENLPVFKYNPAANPGVNAFITKSGSGTIFFQYMYERGFVEGLSSTSNPWYNVFTSTQSFIASDSTTTYTNGTGLSILQVGQFFDLSYTYYTDFLENGSPNLAATIAAGRSYKLDTVQLALGYMSVRHDDVDTIIVILSEATAIGSAADVNMKYPHVGFNVTTKLPTNAQVFKYPVRVDDTAKFIDGSYRLSNFYIPLNKVMTTDKFQISYTFKRQQEGIGALGEVNSMTHFLYKDPASLGYVFSSAINPEFNGNNLNYGLFVDKSTYYDKVGSGYIGYRECTPSLFWTNIHYPFMVVYASCTNCEITGVQEQDAKNVSVYPNPANNTVNVQLANAAPAKIELINLVGQTVISQNVSAENIKMDVSNLNKGIYMVKIAQEGKVYTSKLVVK